MISSADLDRTELRATPEAIPHIDFGGSGETLVFLHANGFPPDCYRPLLESLALDCHVLAVLQRPLWHEAKSKDVASWSVFSDDLLRLLAEEHQAPVIAAGHSLGATVVLRAALRAPDRFAALILMEPVLYPTRAMLTWKLARAIGLGYRRQPMIQRALRRRRTFDSLAQVYESYRRRRVFRYFSDENLRTCIEGMTAPAAGGYRLVYAPEWEARVYYTSIWNDWDLWKGLSSLSLPTLIIRGAESNTFRTSTAEAVRARSPQIRIVTVAEASHLAPLERPGEIARLCIRQLREIRRN
jgi:pimeloyl-ACP methyl ester carboxylesterase